MHNQKYCEMQLQVMQKRANSAQNPEVKNHEVEKLIEATKHRIFPSAQLREVQIKPRMNYLQDKLYSLINNLDDDDDDYDEQVKKKFEEKDLDLEECEKEFDTKDAKKILKEVNNMRHELQFLSNINQDQENNPEKYIDTVKPYIHKQKLAKKTIFSIHFDGPKNEDKRKLKRMKDLSSMIPKQGMQILQIALKNEFFKNKYTESISSIMGRDFKVSLLNNFATNLSILKAAYLLKNHPVYKQIINIYYKASELYTYQKRSNDETCMALINFGQTIQHRQQQLIHISEKMMGLRQKCDQQSEIDKAKKISQLYQNEEIQFKQSLKKFNERYIERIAKLKNQIDLCIQQIGKQDKSLSEILSETKKSKKINENLDQIKKKQAELDAQIEESLNQSLKCLKTEKDQAKEMTKNEIKNIKQKYESKVSPVNQYIKCVKQQEKRDKKQLKKQFTQKQKECSLMMQTDIKVIQGELQLVDPVVQKLRDQLYTFKKEENEKQDLSTSEKKKHKILQRRVEALRKDLENANQRSNQSKRVQQKHIRQRVPVTKYTGFLGWRKEVHYEYQLKKVQQTVYDDCGVKLAKSDYLKASEDLAQFEKYLEQKMKDSQRKRNQIIEKKQKALDKAVEERGKQLAKKLQAITQKQKQRRIKGQNQINLLRQQLKKKQDEVSNESKKKIDDKSAKIKQQQNKMQAEMKQAFNKANQIVQAATLRYHEKIKSCQREKAKLKEEEKKLQESYQESLYKIRELLTNCSVPGLNQQDLTEAASHLLYAINSLQQLARELKQRVNHSEMKIISLKKNMITQVSMDSSVMLRLINEMQDNQFKKHALWIAQMRQSYMITQAKQEQFQLNILAGESIIDQEKGKLLQSQIDSYLSYDPEKKQLSLKKQPSLTIEPSFEQLKNQNEK